jgi:hypothetical protein
MNRRLGSSQEDLAGEEAPPAFAKRLYLRDRDLTLSFVNDTSNVCMVFNGVMLAAHSSYFDALLSSGMEDGRSRNVTLYDVDSEEFQLALAHLEDCSRNLSLRDALIVGPIYSRFQMQQGLMITEGAICHFLDARPVLQEMSSEGINQVINCTLLAYEANLERGLRSGLKALRELFNPYSTSHRGIIQSLSVEEQHVDLARPLITAYAPRLLPESLASSDVSSNLFDKLLVSKLREHVYCTVLHDEGIDAQHAIKRIYGRNLPV